MISTHLTPLFLFDLTFRRAEPSNKYVSRGFADYIAFGHSHFTGRKSINTVRDGSMRYHGRTVNKRNRKRFHGFRL